MTGWPFLSPLAPPPAPRVVYDSPQTPTLDLTDAEINQLLVAAWYGPPEEGPVQALRDMLDVILAERVVHDSPLPQPLDPRDAEIATLRAENARLQAALKPFAEAIDPEHALPDDLDVCLASCGTGRGIKIGHYRDARAALTDTGAV